MVARARCHDGYHRSSSQAAVLSMEKGQVMGKVMLTGDRPTGKLHLGHYVGSLRRRVELQD